MVYVHDEASCRARWGVVEAGRMAPVASPRTRSASVRPIDVRLDDGMLVTTSASLLCPIGRSARFPATAAGRWDFHPPAPRIM